MIVPKLHFIDVCEKLEGFRQLGDVVAREFMYSAVDLYVLENCTVGTKKREKESALRVGVNYPVYTLQREKFCYRERIPIVEQEGELSNIQLVRIKMLETERFVDACAAYKDIAAELLDKNCAISLHVHPDDEGVVRYFGYFDTSWHSVEFIFTPAGKVVFTVNFFENENTGEMVSSDYGWKKLIADKNINDNEKRIRCASWNVFEPKVCVLIGIKEEGLLELDDMLHDNGLQNDCIFYGTEHLEILRNCLSVVLSINTEHAIIFSVYGSASSVEEFILDLSEYYEKNLLFVHRFEKDKYLQCLDNEISLCRDEFMCKKRREFMIGLIVVLKSCEIPPYVILEILDWNTCIQTMDHKEKINLIYAIQKSINSIIDKRESNKKIKM